MVSSESIWSSMTAIRQLSSTYYTLSTCLTDLLHRYFEISSSSTNNISSSLFYNLDQTLFSSSTISANQSKLLDEYSNILQNILKQNTLHKNIIQNVRRLFRSDSCLKQLFTTELNEYCQCQECDCTISNSITDVIHDVGEIRTTLLIESNQLSCACFRCGDQNQMKTLTFKQFSPCLALTVNRLNINATDQLTTAQGLIYDLTYIIEFDSTSRSIINVYLRENAEFIKVDGIDISSRLSTINSQGKFLTLWLSRSTSLTPSQLSETITTIPHNDTFLSPPQSASSSQLTSNSITNNDICVSSQSTIILDDTLMSSVPSQSTITHDDTLTLPVPYQNTIDQNTIDSDDTVLSSVLMLSDNPLNDAEDDQFWQNLSQQPIPSMDEEMSTTNNDSISDIYLTLLHTTNKDSSPIKTRTEHDRTVNTLASDVLWPLIVDQTNRRNEKKSTSSTTTTTNPSLSSNSSTSSITRRNQLYKQKTSTMRSRRPNPYTTA